MKSEGKNLIVIWATIVHCSGTVVYSPPSDPAVGFWADGSHLHFQILWTVV